MGKIPVMLTQKDFEEHVEPYGLTNSDVCSSALNGMINISMDFNALFSL